MSRSAQSKQWDYVKAIAMLSVFLFFITTVVCVTQLKLWLEFQRVSVWLFEHLMSFAQMTNYPDLHDFPKSSKRLLLVLCFTALGSVSVSACVIWWFRIRHDDDSLFTHLSGPKLLKHRLAQKHFAKKCKAEQPKGLKIHPQIWLSVIREFGNFLVWGMQGGGKSNLIKWLVSQLIARGERTAIYDIKGEYTEIFYNEKCLLLSPRDERSINWNLGQDITNIGLAEVFAEAVISSAAVNEAFWTDSARLVVIGVIVGLIKEQKPWSWSELSKRLFCDDAELSAWLKKYHPQAATLIQPDDKTTASIRSMVATQLAWINSVENVNPNNPEFSVKEWLSTSDRNVLIVQGDLTAPLMSAALITSFMAILSNYVLSGPDSDRNIWLVLDELATLNKSKSFQNWLAVGRSKGARTIAGAQLLSQLESIYGKDDANTILGLFSNVVTFKLAPNGDSAQKASSALGQRRVEFRTESINEKGEKNYSLQQENVPVVTAESIIHLPLPSLKYGIEGFLLIGGLDAVYHLSWPINTFSKVAPAVVLPSLPTEPTPTTSFNRLNRRS